MAFVRLVPGPPGKDGKDGKDGVDGSPGRDGIDGSSGRDGIDGKEGLPGIAGADGVSGRDGRDGKDGVDGKTVIDLDTVKALQTQLDDLLSKFKKLQGRKAESVYIGGGGGDHAEEIVVTFDGGGSVLTPGDTKTYYTIPYSGVLSAWYLTGNPSGSLQLDVWKIGGGLIPSVANTICNGDKPTLNSTYFAARTSLNTALWKTSVSAGDIFGFNIDSVSSVTKAVLTLKLTRNV